MSANCGLAFGDGRRCAGSRVRRPRTVIRYLFGFRSPPPVVLPNTNSRSAARMTLSAPSTAFGALSWPRAGL